MSLGDFLSGLGDVAQTAIQTTPAILQALQSNQVTAFPSFGQAPFPGVPAFPSLTSGLPIAGTTGAAVQASGGCPSFVPTRTRMRAVPELRAINPTSGKIESWTHRGSPLVWSGDRAIAKRYAKAAGFTMRRRRSGGHTHTTRRTRKK